MQDKAIKIIKQFIKEEKWHSYLVILPNQHLIDNFIKSLLAENISGLLYPQFYTFETFMAKVLKDNDNNLFYISDITKDALLKELSMELSEKGNFHYFKGEIREGIVNYISEAISELKQNLITPNIFSEAIKSLDNKRLHDLAIIYAAYVNKLNSSNLKDKEDKFYDLLKILNKEDNLLLENVEYAYIDWFIDNTLIQQHIFATIINEVSQVDGNFSLYGQTFIDDICSEKNVDNEISQLIFTDIETKALSPKIGVFNKRGREEEVESVVHEVIRLLEIGVKPSDIAIVARNPQDYGEILFTNFNDIGVNVELELLKPLITNQLIKSLLLMLNLVTYPHKPFSLATWLSNHYLSEEFGDKDLVMEWSYKKGENTLDEWLSLWIEEGQEVSLSCYNEIQNMLTNIKELWDLIIKEGSRLDIISSIADSMAKLNLEEKIKDFPEDISLPARFSLYYRDKEALLAFTDMLNNLKLAWADNNINTNLANLVTSIKNYAENINYTEKKSYHGGIKVLSPTAIRGLKFHTVFVLGMEQNVFPKIVTQNPILRDRERLILKSNFYLPLSSEIYEREKILFYLTILASREELILTYADTNEEGQANLPSLFLEDILNLTDENNLLTPYIPAFNPINISNKLAHLLEVEDYRNSNSFSSYEGCFSDAILKQGLASKVEKEIYSISRLNLFAKCPLKYFFIIELGLDDEILVRDRLSPLELGSLKHEVLARILKNPANIDINNLLALTTKTIEEICQENGWEGREYPHQWLWELEKKEIAERLTELIEAELSRGIFKPAHFEWRFGFDKPFIIKNGEEKVSLRGVIDRIDTDGAGHYAIYDYKESANMSRYEVENAKELQLPVYIMAVENLLGEVVGTAYIEIKTGKLKHYFYHNDYKALVGFDSARTKGLTADEWQVWLDNIKLQIINYAQNIKEGKFPPTPYTCDYCHLRDICLYDPARIRLKQEISRGDY